MLPFFNYTETELLCFILMLLRISAFIVTWPIFGERQVPSSVKVLLSLVLTLVLFPITPVTLPETELFHLPNAWLALKEVFIGATLGFFMRMIFFTVGIAGQLASMAMGLSNAQMINPAFGGQSMVVEQFQIAIATLFFLAINGHHLFLLGLSQSFDLVPISQELLSLEHFSHFGHVTGEVIKMGLRMASPVVAALLFMNIAMGVIGRAVPQINVFITSLPISALLGIGILFVGLPLLLTEVGQLAGWMAEEMLLLMKEI